MYTTCIHKVLVKNYNAHYNLKEIEFTYKKKKKSKRD